jgi:type IV pilus assembly protein PilA
MLCPQCNSPLDGPSQACPQCAPSSVAHAAGSPSPILDVKAILSFLLGALSIVPLSIFAGVPAVVLGHLSRVSVRKSQGRLKGSGLALAGLIMGYVSLALLPVVLFTGIAIPRLFRGQIAANEASAVNTLRSINYAATTYRTEHNAYPATLQELGAASLFPLDNAVTSFGTQSGYRFTYKPSASGGGYVLRADPISLATGQSHFFSDASGVIRSEKDHQAGSGSASVNLQP